MTPPPPCPEKMGQGRRGEKMGQGKRGENMGIPKDVVVFPLTRECTWVITQRRNNSLYGPL